LLFYAELLVYLVHDVTTSQDNSRPAKQSAERHGCLEKEVYVTKTKSQEQKHNQH